LYEKEPQKAIGYHQKSAMPGAFLEFWLRGRESHLA